MSEQGRQLDGQAPFPTRLVRLAAHLQRLASLVEQQNSDAMITALINECQQAIEGSTPAFPPERREDAAYLVNVQRGLARWLSLWEHVQSNPVERRQLIEQAREWSVEILYLSGLVDE